MPDITNSPTPLIVKCPRCKGGVRKANCKKCHSYGEIEFGFCGKCQTVTHIHPTPDSRSFGHHSLCNDCMVIQKELLGIAPCDNCKRENELWEWEYKKIGYKHFDLLCQHCYHYYHDVLHDEGRI